MMMKIAKFCCLLLALLSANVSAKSTDVKKPGVCTQSATSKIKLSPENGKLEIEFEVENKANEVWKVVIKRRGTTIYSQNKRTGATSQSFTARVVNGPGTGGLISAVATSQSSGEKCSVSATYA